MGGKKKYNISQPRTKGNTKPSNSDKSARFLIQQTGGLDIPTPSFLGEFKQTSATTRENNGGKSGHGKLSGFVPTIYDPDLCGLNSSIVNVLKRLEKRDAITKQKSLRDFLDLLKSNSLVGAQNTLSADSVVAMLPFWPRLYCRLSFDPDYKVRELTQGVMHALAISAGKELANYLKQIIPTWLFATCDTYESAALSASQGLANIFPASKLSDVKRFCAGKLLNFFDAEISELFKPHVSRNKQQNKTDSTDYVKLKHDIIKIANSLHFLTCFVNDIAKLPSDHRHLTRLKKLLCPSNLWTKLANYLQNIERVYYPECNEYIPFLYNNMLNLASTLCSDDNWIKWFTDSDDGSKLARYICMLTVGNLGQSNDQFIEYESVLIPTAYPEIGTMCYESLWNSAINCLMHVSPDFVWSVVEWRHSFLPRMHYLFSHSCTSEVKQLYSNLLCLMSTFPLDYTNLQSCDMEVLECFVNASVQGLRRLLNADGSILLRDNPNISVVVVSGILECVRFLIDRLLSDEVNYSTDKCNLANRIYEEVVLRIFFDCINKDYAHVSDDKSHLLICHKLPSIWDSYLNAVFTQLSLLCNYLAQSGNVVKSGMFQLFRDKFLECLQATTTISSYTDKHHLCTGTVDSLLLIKFIGNLVASSSSQIVRKYKPTQCSERGNCTTVLDNYVSVAKANWCLDLLITIADIVQRCLTTLDSNNYSHILILLCIYGHLPFKQLSSLSLLNSVFNTLLPKLHEKLLPNCETAAVVDGFIKVWLASDKCQLDDLYTPPSTIVCSRFINHLLPFLLNRLPLLEHMIPPEAITNRSLPDELHKILSSWINNWFLQLTNPSEYKYESPSEDVVNAVSNLHCLLQGMLVHCARGNTPAATIYTKLIHISCVHLIDHISLNLISDCTKFVLEGELSVIGTGTMCVLESWHKYQDYSLALPEYEYVGLQMEKLYFMLINILVMLYEIDYRTQLAKADNADKNSDKESADRVSNVSILAVNELITKIESRIYDQLDCNANTTDLFVDNLIRAILLSVVHTRFVNLSFRSFISQFYERLKKNADKCLAFNRLWLDALAKQTLTMFESLDAALTSSFNSVSYSLSRHLLPHCGGLFPLNSLPKLGELVRLYALGTALLAIHRSQFLSASSDVDQRIYLLCTGLLRVCIECLVEPFDLSVDFGWLESSEFTAFDESKMCNLKGIQSDTDSYCERFRKQLSADWVAASAPYSLDHLVSEETLDCLIKSNRHLLLKYWNLLLLNKARTIHPNLWPPQFKSAAICNEGEPCSPISSFCDWFTPSQLVNEEHRCQFIRFCELYLPAGIVRRCLPRQELFARLKSVTLSPNESVILDNQNAMLSVCANVCELIAAAVSVRTTAPLFITTFASIILEDYHKLITLLSDSLCEENRLSDADPQSIQLLISVMSYLQSLLLLWQPWQWSGFHTDKSPIINRLSLIQLSTRIRQLRPHLDPNQWDSIVCLVISWVSMSVQSDLTEFGIAQNDLSNIFAYHSFRVGAALGVIFIGSHSILPNLSDLLVNTNNGMSTKLNLLSDALSENEEIEFGDDEPTDEFSKEVDEVNKILHPEEQATISSKQPNDINTDSFNFEGEEDNIEFDSDVNADEFINSMDETEDSDEELYSALIKGLPLVPKRGQPPVLIQNDWEQFFAKNMYSPLLLFALKQCIMPGQQNYQFMINAQPCVQALCALLATCPASQLIRILHCQPNRIAEYLGEVGLDSKQNHVFLEQIVPGGQQVTVNDFTVGFRTSLNYACALIAHSTAQCGQLLGHILLNRLCAVQVIHKMNQNKSVTLSIANYVIRRLPDIWLSSIYGDFPKRLEQFLLTESALDQWGDGAFTSTFFMNYTTKWGWSLNCEAHKSILRYLLAWDSLLNLMNGVGPQTRACLQQALLGCSCAYFDRFLMIIGLLLPSSDHFKRFIDQPCRLEPDERLLLPNSVSRAYLATALSVCSSRKYNRRPINLTITPISGDDKHWRDPFRPDDPLLYLPGRRCAIDLSHFAVRLFRRFLSEAPSLMRAWYSNLTAYSNSHSSSSNLISPFPVHKAGRLRQLATTINKLVSVYFSPGLARDEVVLVQYRSYLRMIRKEYTSSSSWFNLLKSAPEDGTVRIRSRPVSRELIATYFLADEHSFEMCIQLPTNYPLSQVTVSKGHGIGISAQQWQSWILQLSVYINNHNGSILHGIDLWQQNVRKKLDGVGECAICYSIVHSKNFSLPKLQCHTCKKLFHYACMYKWFTTSRNTTCPLCRQFFFNPTGRSTC